MEKNIKRDNRLIKIRNLKLKLKTEGINRVSKKAMLGIERHIEKYLINRISLMKERMLIQGKKVLEDNEVKEVFSGKEEEYWEV